MFNAVEKVLSNGIKLITVKKDTQISSLHLGIKIGSIYENPDEKGISHFIEHMLFKGTEKRSNEKLNAELENLGGEYNAYTDYTCTVYSITNLEEELEKSIEIISDMILNPTFECGEIERERKVILSEIKSGNDDIEQLSFRKINEAAFKKSPLRYDTCGTEDTIKVFTKKKLMEFYRKFYVPNNCFISVVSHYEHDYVLKLVQKYFSSWEYRKVESRKVVAEKNFPCMKSGYKRDIEQSTVMFLFTLYDLSKKEELALRILNHKLGESANSILFRKLREERGLAYDVYTDLNLTQYVKTLYIYTAVNEENIEVTVNTVLKCIEDIKDENIVFDSSSISIMKKALKTAVAFTLEDSTDIGEYVLSQSIEGNSIFKFVEDIKEIEKVKEDDIYKVARKIFNDPTIYILRESDKE
ncbi:MAG: insulinase family protein [Clostridium sp.]|jgi:predicted Zn-dependent peptidase|uniref:M16 family metallopeptidase n=1 Tax=Clostridium sp. TaxID=1506 RepID=UPI0025C437E1|nr:pitrilysin family protein [Clostridium sp.]MCH3963191.1 insulinase family protein [Clostridium sp.]MCI1716346.1 insulinase family protein [Clostridium sp.]MCI1800686.1 insulinase family protein [Clostridium sp.]MCI1814659.1 insulinase family protein [Clostridium sp.]MCI1871569.1 insulinase family protein [Clostridium sp.]